MKPSFMKELYDKCVTPEIQEKVKNMPLEDCGIIIVNKDYEHT